MYENINAWYYSYSLFPDNLKFHVSASGPRTPLHRPQADLVTLLVQS